MTFDFVKVTMKSAFPVSLTINFVHYVEKYNAVVYDFLSALEKNILPIQKNVVTLHLICIEFK